MDPDKRDLRQHKRLVKKAGQRHARRALKADLAANPETADETEIDFGRHSSTNFNGMDQDSTRKKKD